MRLGSWAMSALALAATGCEDAREAPPPAHQAVDGPANAAAIAAALGAGAAIAAETVVHLSQPGHGSVGFHLHWWCDADGRVKLAASKENVDFCTAELARDGSYRALLPRDHLWTQGMLAGDPQRPLGLVGAMRLCAQQLVEGPLPAKAAFRAGPDPRTVLCALADGLSLQATLDADAREVEAVRLFSGAHQELLSASCQRYQAFDDLRRPTDVHVSFPDGASAHVLLVKLQDVPRISPERMAMERPADARVVALEAFLDHLQRLSD
jgi:hypothetical protein